jgi:putative DNA primase/helicase
MHGRTYGRTIDARTISDGLGGRVNGSGFLCRCPVPGHTDKHPSLRITEIDGKVLFKCWGGCSQDAVIAALRSRGLWGGKPINETYRSRAEQGASSGDAFKAKDDPKAKDPMRSWRNASLFFRGSVTDLYLKRRAIELTDDEARSIRVASSLWHWVSKTRWPCMLARVTLADGTEITTHQTFLEFDGGGKAPIEKPRLFVSGGRTSGGAVWFGQAHLDQEFVVAEGIESALSALRIYGVKAGCAALSAGGIRQLVLPVAAQKVRIFADNDELGQSIAAARDAARRWRAEGRVVAATMSEGTGEDANDVLLRRLKFR